MYMPSDVPVVYSQNDVKVKYTRSSRNAHFGSLKKLRYAKIALVGL